MDFLYYNSKTGTFAEFSIKGIDKKTEPSRAIELFLSSVASDEIELRLPDSLLKLLTDKEIDLFMLSPYEKRFLQALEDMVFVANESVLYDAHSNPYHLEYIGKNSSIVSIDTLDSVEVFSVPSNAIKGNMIDLSEVSHMDFGSDI